MLKNFAFLSMLALLFFPGQSLAEKTLYPAENPSPNGAYILCAEDDMGKCYDLREKFLATNTQVEHIADRILLRTGGSGFMQTRTATIPLSWAAPNGNLVKVVLEDGKNTTWELIPEGAFLAGPKTFIFMRSEREYEASEGGEITIP